MKIKITEDQYKKILLHEHSNRSLINEQNNEVVLGIALLAGLDLTGHNKKIADEALSKEDILSKIKSTLENKDKLKNIADNFEEKGMEDPSNFLSKNANKIKEKFNSLSNDKKLDFLSMSILKNFNQK